MDPICFPKKCGGCRFSPWCLTFCEARGKPIAPKDAIYYGIYRKDVEMEDEQAYIALEAVAFRQECAEVFT